MRSYQHCIKNSLGKRNHEQGFTLIEILIAVAVLAFGLLAVSSLQGGAIRGNLMALDRTEAVAWAQTQMESLMALPYANVVSGGPTVQDIYEINWTVFPDDPIPNCKRIIVTVSYKEKGIQRGDVVLTCVKPNV
jgi:prepilin-type N-terminal cleavage/methylation domain-containing protein